MTDNSPLTRHGWPVLVLLLLGVSVYANSLRGEFQFDDRPVIVANDALRSAGPLELWEAVDHPARYLTYLTFWANYRLNGLDPFGYHVINLTIHLINTLLVYALVQLLAKTPLLSAAFAKVPPRWAAMIAAALFVCHPLNTQAVSYITQRFTSLATLFYVGALCCYLSGRLSPAGRRRVLWWLAAIVSATAGMFTKQIVLTVPLMTLVIEFACFDRRSRSGAAVLLVAAAALTAVVPALYHFRAGDILSITHENGNHPGDIVNAGTYALTQPRVVLTYLRLLVWPAGQTLLHDFPVTSGWGDTRLWAGALMLLLLLSAAAAAWRNARPVSLGILWFFIALLIEATVIPIRHVIFEHRAYLPSVGIFVAAAWLLCRALRSQRAVLAAAVSAVAILSILTVQRNRVWHSGTAMWTDVVRKYPRNARAHYNLAYEYVKDKRTDAALEHFNKAVLIDPDYELAYLNRSQLLLDRDHIELALHDINKVIKLNDRRAEAYLNRGAILRRAGRFGDALDDFERARKIDPGLQAATINLALTMGNLGRFTDGLRAIDELTAAQDAPAKALAVRGALQMGANDLTGALESFTRGIRQDPGLAELYRNRAQVYQALGRYERAEEDLSELIRRTPVGADVYLQRAYIRTRLHRMAGALDDYAAVARQQPEMAQVYLERGKIFYRLGEYLHAAEEFDRYLNRAPDSADAFMLRGLSHYELREFRQALADFTRARELGYDVDEAYFRRTRAAMGSI